jgi:hypothetical protein
MPARMTPTARQVNAPVPDTDSLTFGRECSIFGVRHPIATRHPSTEKFAKNA